MSEVVVCGDHVRVGDSCESGGGGDFGPSAMDFGQSPRMVKVILRCPLLGWVAVGSATFEAWSDPPQEGLRRDDGHKTGGEPRRSVEHGSPVETVSGDVVSPYATGKTEVLKDVGRRENDSPWRK